MKRVWLASGAVAVCIAFAGGAYWRSVALDSDITSRMAAADALLATLNKGDQIGGEWRVERDRGFLFEGGLALIYRPPTGRSLREGVTVDQWCELNALMLPPIIELVNLQRRALRLGSAERPPDIDIASLNLDDAGDVSKCKEL